MPLCFLIMIIVYDVYMLCRSMENGYTASTESWIATLSIATRLLFDAIRARAIEEITRQLDSIDAIELVLLANKFDVNAWLAPAFSRVVERDDMLTDNEATRLTFADLLLIMRCRETCRKLDNPRTLLFSCTGCGRTHCRCGNSFIVASAQELSVLPALPVIHSMLASRSAGRAQHT